MMKNKRGVLGLDTATAFVIAIMILAIMTFVSIIVVGSLNDSSAAAQTVTGTVVNESFTLLNQTANSSATLLALDGTVTLSNVLLVNTTGSFIQAPNYTVVGRNVLGATDAGDFIGQVVNISADFSNTNSQFKDISRNVTAGYAELFTNATTWFSLLGVVILILIIGLVIIAVRRFDQGANSTGL